ncbi:hypothetical protein VTK26DRAFT_2895 [Humicola hyalothermophila]
MADTFKPVDLSTLPPEYVNANNSARIIGIVGAFHFLALTFVTLRVYVRVFMVRAFGVDDGLIIGAGVCALISWICLVLQKAHGLGRHAVVLSYEERVTFERIGYWKAFFSDGLAMGLLRISMAISLMRLNKDIKWYRYSLYAVIVFVTLYTLEALIWMFVYCKPYSGWYEFQWANPFDPRCADFNIFLNLTYFNIACNVFTDVVLGALPIPIIWNLKLKLRVRLYVIGILNLGYLAIVMGVLKAVFMLTTGGNPDHIFNYWVHFWENLQLNIGIIAACASFLKPLVGRILKINSTFAYSYQSGGAYARSGRTPMGLQTIGSKYAGGGRRPRRAADGSHVDDEFELHTKHDHLSTPSPISASGDGSDDVSVVGGEIEKGRGTVITRVHALTRSNADHTSAEAVGGLPSDSNSEEIILQKPEPARGIMMRRDVTVRYSNE